MKTFLKTVEAKAAKDKIRAGVDFMQLHGLKRLPLESFALVRENGHIINVLKEITTRKVTRRLEIGFVRVNVEKKVSQHGKIVLD
jgi:hypothetical protein